MNSVAEEGTAAASRPLLQQQQQRREMKPTNLWKSLSLGRRHDSDVNGLESNSGKLKCVLRDTLHWTLVRSYWLLLEREYGVGPKSEKILISCCRSCFELPSRSK